MSEIKDTDLPIYEIYALRLDHYIEDQGDRHPLDEPLVVKMVYDRRYIPLPICINNMIDKMRDEMLKRVGGES